MTWQNKIQFNSIQFNSIPTLDSIYKKCPIFYCWLKIGINPLCLEEHMTKMYLFIYFIITPLILTKNNPSNCYLSKNLQLTHYEWCKNYVFNKISILSDTTKRGVRRWKEAQRQGDFVDFSNMLHLFMPQKGCGLTFYDIARNSHASL